MMEIPQYVWLAITMLVLVKVAREFLLLGILAKIMNSFHLDTEDHDG